MSTDTTTQSTDDALTAIAESLQRDIERAERQLVALAQQRSPVTLRDLANDSAFDRQVMEFRDRYETFDHTLLDEPKDADDWDLVSSGTHDRYVVRDTEEEDGTWYQVYDAYEDKWLDKSDEYSYAEEEAERANRDETIDTLHGFPFAQNVGFIINQYEVQQFAAAGFLVWRYKGGELIAGIDGGGYNMLDAHWKPLWFARCIEAERLVETETGPRRAAK